MKRVFGFKIMNIWFLKGCSKGILIKVHKFDKSIIVLATLYLQRILILLIFALVLCWESDKTSWNNSIRRYSHNYNLKLIHKKYTFLHCFMRISLGSSKCNNLLTMQDPLIKLYVWSVSAIVYDFSRNKLYMYRFWSWRTVGNWIWVLVLLFQYRQ